MVRSLTVFAALVILGGGVLGCKPKGVQPAKTPKEAIVNYTRAIESGDKAAFTQSIEVAPDEKDAADAVFEEGSALMALRKAMNDAYGKDGFSKLGEKWAEEAKKVPTGDDVNAKVKITPESPADQKKVDRAEASMPNEKSSMTLVKNKDGVWKVALFQSHKPTADEIARAKVLANAFRSVQKKIGQEDVTAEYLGRQLQAEMEKAGYTATQPTSGATPSPTTPK